MSANYFELDSVVMDINKIIAKRGLEVGGRVQTYIDTQVLRLSEPLIPKDTGELIRSGILNTNLGSGVVKYRTPYARRWYYMPAKFQEAPQRGNYWFERMKQQYLSQILAGAQRRSNE